MFVGGPPALTLAAVMPLPEGLPELAFAGALGGPPGRGWSPPDGGLPDARRGRLRDRRHGRSRRAASPRGRSATTWAITAWRTTSRSCASIGCTTARAPSGRSPSVGRPPQEDTTFGELIHELTGPIIPTVIPGVHAVHAVDAAGVHPLLLAIASERYVPYAPSTPAAGDADRRQRDPRPGAAVAGQVPAASSPGRTTPASTSTTSPAFFRHVLERVDWTDDLHFQTRTTIDTLDYSGHGLNQGSKVVIAAAGPAPRTLPTRLPAGLRLPEGFRSPASAPARRPGVAGARAIGPRCPSIAALLRRSRPRRSDPTRSP